MLKGLLIFGGGIYTGVYIAQNYQIEKVEDPMTLFSKISAAIQSTIDDISKKSK